MPAEPTTEQLGISSFVAFGEETVYGTAFARSKFLEIVPGESVEYGDVPIKRDSIAANGAPSIPGFVNGKVTGAFSVEANFEGMEKLLKHLMGTVTEAQLSGAAYYHTFSLAQTMPVGLTLEIARGATVTDVLVSSVYEGCKIESLDFTIRKDKPALMAFGVIGEDETLAVRPAPTFPAYLPIISPHYGTPGSITVGSAVPANIVDGKLSIKNTFGDDRYLIGTNQIKEPRKTGPTVITGSFTGDFGILASGATPWTTYFKQVGTRASAPVVLPIVIDAQGPVITGSYYYQFKFDLPNSYVTALKTHVSSMGRVTQEITWESTFDAANANGPTIRLQNTVNTT